MGTFEQWERRDLQWIGHLSQRDALQALQRSIPVSTLAGALAEEVLGRLGDDARLDPYAAPRDRLIKRLDPATGWWSRRSLVELRYGAEQHEAESAWADGPRGPVLPEDAPEGWHWGAPYWPVDPEPDVLPAYGERALLGLYDGPSWVELRYDDRGVLRREGMGVWELDPFARLRWPNRPFAVDRRARPPRAGPLGALIDARLDPAGVPVGTLAEMLVDQPIRDPVRIHMPLPCPGGGGGTWWRASRALRARLWADGAPDGAGWAIADGFSGTAIAFGATFAEAERAWRDEVARVRPRPPVEPRVDLDDDETDVAPAETTDLEDGRKIVTMSARFVLHPVVVIPWPIPLPANVPAAAVPLRTRPPVPDVWARAGFTRFRDLLADDGVHGFALERVDADGHTWVGEGLLDAVDPTGLDGAIDALIAHEKGDRPDGFGTPPWLRDEYPVERWHFRGWDNGAPGPAPLRGAGSGFSRSFDPVEPDGGGRWTVTRQRIRR